MTRFLLRNTVRDPKFAALRKKNETRISLRPFIGGKPLPPAATRIMVLSDLTVSIIAEIEALVAIGNVEFLAVGRQGPAIDFRALRQELGRSVPVAELTAPPAVEETVKISEPVVTEPAVEEPVVAEAPAVKVWTRGELEAEKLVSLRDTLTALGGKPASKNKATLVDEILAAQDGV